MTEKTEPKRKSSPRPWGRRDATYSARKVIFRAHSGISGSLSERGRREITALLADRPTDSIDLPTRTGPVPSSFSAIKITVAAGLWFGAS